jgi:SAM-dependent methyltransferase
MGMTTETNSGPLVSTLPEGAILESAGPSTALPLATHESPNANGTVLAETSPTIGAHEWARNRPRLLSYVGRWGRARRWLPADARQVLDLGCGFGYGTVALWAHSQSPRWIVGVDRDGANVELCRRSYPWLPILRSDARLLPFPDHSVDAVVTLDVLEHLDDPGAVLAAVHRVLRPGGALVVSVPHRGLLSACDSNNIYTALCRRHRGFVPLEPCEESASGRHRHFTLAEARDLLGPGFAVDRVARTAIGLAEILHIFLLVVFKGLLRWRGAYLVLRYVYFAATLVEDLIPAGRFGYNLTLRARATPIRERPATDSSRIGSAGAVVATPDGAGALFRLDFAGVIAFDCRASPTAPWAPAVARLSKILQRGPVESP